MYCLTCIGSLPPSAVAISAKPASVAVPPTLIRKKSLSAILPYTRSAELAPVTVAVTNEEVAAVKLVAALEEETANELDNILFDPKGPDTFDAVTNKLANAKEAVPVNGPRNDDAETDPGN